VHITESTDDAPDRVMYVFLAAACNNTQWLWKFGESDSWNMPAQNIHFGTGYKKAVSEVWCSLVYCMANYLKI